MPPIDLFSSVTPRAVDANGAFVQRQMRQHETELFTGIFHITGKSSVVFLFFQGKIASVYLFENGAWKAESKMRWNDAMLAGSGELRVISMPVDGLRIARLFFEADLGEYNTIPPMPAEQVGAYLSHWNRGNRAGLATMKQNGSNAILLFPAQEISANEAVLFDSTQTQTGPNALNQVKAWGSDTCQIALCAYEPKSEAWKEYSLRVSFGAFLQSVLKRYEEFAGRFLVSNLDEQVNQEARNWGFAFSLYGHTFSNRHYFENAEKASHAYCMIFSLVGSQMGAVVGDKMAASINKDAILQLDLDPRMLVQEYVISRIGK